MPLTHTPDDGIEVYLVGGAVRDRTMTLSPKDWDFTVVAPSFRTMKNFLLANDVDIFLEVEQFGTIRGSIPEERLSTWRPVSAKPRTVAVDFVLARTDGYYSDGRRPDSVAPGTILDDLSRRDFTVNAMALDESYRLLDPFNGFSDLVRKDLKTVRDAVDVFKEDALRAVRAVRFAVTKDFRLSPDIEWALKRVDVMDRLRDNVATDRVREELLKCFRHDTPGTLRLLKKYDDLSSVIFDHHGIWLEPTVKSR